MSKSKKLWGSRFKKGTDPLADKFTYSISYDYRLAKYDVLGSIAHAKMLGDCKIISKTDSMSLTTGLKKILKQINDGKYQFDPKSEDVHTDIQSKLKDIIGDAADKLHTARSRNDLVALDMKMYCLEEIDQLIHGITNMQKSIVRCAHKYDKVLVPAYTHLQSAQVVLFAHYLLAFVEMLERDKNRLMSTKLRTNVMPLGSCALSGTSLPIDRDSVAKQLKFPSVTENSIDSVSDRDFVVETISDLALMGIHLSRISEDFIIWATKEFDFIDIDWAYCTGSSIMPHKKNPDVLELIRGESAKLCSNLNEILMLLKGLPLTYNRDLQLDKPPLFESVERSKDMLKLMSRIFAGLKVKRGNLTVRFIDESFFTVDIMEYLIKKGVSYRKAHDTVGKIVKTCLDESRSIYNLTEAELKKHSPHLGTDIKKLLNPDMSVKIKKSAGSTNPSLVLRQIKQWKNKLNA